MHTTAAPPSRRAQRARPRRRVSVIGVIGELLITVGVVVLLYVAWQMWIGDLIYAAEKNQVGAELSQEWQQQAAASTPDAASPTPSASAGADAEGVGLATSGVDAAACCCHSWDSSAPTWFFSAA